MAPTHGSGGRRVALLVLPTSPPLHANLKGFESLCLLSSNLRALQEKEENVREAMEAYFGPVATVAVRWL